jgi:hypothetical protein
MKHALTCLEREVNGSIDVIPVKQGTSTIAAIIARKQAR